MTGVRYGEWVVLSFYGYRSGAAQWLCRCSCAEATTRPVFQGNLERGTSTNCGCVQYQRKREQYMHNLAGRTINGWRVVGKSHQNKCGHWFWHVVCQCGAPAVRSGSKLESGETKQCRRCGAKQAGLTRTTHGMSYSREYNIWHAINSRCHCPTNRVYARYGGRGIKVCRRWRRSFAAFLADMGPRPSPKHSVDRIHNGRGYSPRNCRWATPTEQGRNRRACHFLTFRGQTLPVTAWAERTSLKATTIYGRLRQGWTTRRTLETPLRQPGQPRHTRRNSGRPEYSCWLSMKARCLYRGNVRYKNYGGRGIRVCGRWRDSFLSFLEDVGPRPSPSHSLHRLDVNGHYEPGNIVWADKLTQANSTRNTRRVTLDGETLSLSDWARRTGIPKDTIRNRLDVFGWDVRRTLTSPNRSWHRPRANKKQIIS